MIGQTISHYRIVAKVGEGGMGVVYKAEDLVLRRTVALKFLGEQVAGKAEGRTRFLYEAQAAAMIDHPNVCAVYGFEEAGDRVFIVMAYVEGVSLGHRLRAGGIPLRESLGVAIQIGEGLRAAHTKRIVHRDIKPANILLTADGTVRITDFGLALLGERTRITAPGTLMGTVAYMSPEQALTQTVDHRADIWALGVVLYEMVAGKPPFSGRDPHTTLTSVIRDPPPELLDHGRPVPQFLKAVIRKTLAKPPAERYQHVDDLIVDLRAISRELPETSPRVASPALLAAQEAIPTQSIARPLVKPGGVRPVGLKGALQFIAGKIRGSPDSL